MAVGRPECVSYTGMIGKASADRRGGRPGPNAVLRRALEHVVVRYAVAVAMVAAAFGLKKLLEPMTGTGAPFVLFFAAVAISALLVGRGPAIFATVLTLPLGAYIFVVRAGHPTSQAAYQAALFAVDGVIVVYLSHLVTNAREAAESTEERLRLANEAAAIVSWDLEVASQHLRWSPNTAAFPGLPEGEPANLAGWLDLVHPDDRAAFECAYQQSLDPAGDGTMRCECRVVLTGGVVRWFSWEGRTYYQQRASGRMPARQVGTAIDITDRRQREEALRALSIEISRSEARWRDLLELAPDAFFLADLDGRLTDVNQAACRMLATDAVVRFTVEDTGPGIAGDVRAIFEPFAQGTNISRHGLGLGLYISKCIVAAHGGDIWVDKTSKEGSVFCFTLPVS